jgi:hypothetical protein
VLWMGNRQGERRSRLIDQVREGLTKHGVTMYVADGQENPFIFREERSLLLNRAKISLNITRTWYDDNFSRFALVAPNRSLIVSEHLLPHCPTYEPGVHYVATEPENLAKTIVYYLRRPELRTEIVERAYRLATTQLTFSNSIKKLLMAVELLPQQASQNRPVDSLLIPWILLVHNGRDNCSVYKHRNRFFYFPEQTISCCKPKRNASLVKSKIMFAHRSGGNIAKARTSG